MSASVHSLSRSEAARLAAARPDSITPPPDPGAVLVAVARAYAHTPQHTNGQPTTPQRALLDPLVTAVTGPHVALHGLLVVAAGQYPETVEDHLTVIDRAQRLVDGDDPTSAHAVCCNDECGCTPPARGSQPPAEVCPDCQSGLVESRDEKTTLLLDWLTVLFGAPVVAMAVRP